MRDGVVGHIKAQRKGFDIGVQGSKKGINRSGLSMGAGCLKVLGITRAQGRIYPSYVAKHGGKVIRYGVQHLVETSEFGIGGLVSAILRNALFSGHATSRPLTKTNAMSRHTSLWFFKR